MFKRIIPRLDIKGPNLVKGIHLEGLRVLGKPEQFAKYYYEQGADELMFIDCVASLYERNSLMDIIRKTAKEIFIPLTVGGGIRTLEDIKNILRAGADKVSLNTAAIRNPELIREASNRFGSSTVVVTIEAIQHADGLYYAYIDNGREETGKEVVAWAKECEQLGAGELLITSVDKEGTGSGANIDLINKLTAGLTIPVIAHGGIGNKEHVAEVFSTTSVSAVALASILHYDAVANIHYEKADYSLEGNTSFLKQGASSGRFSPFRISDIKAHLVQQHIDCRVD